MEGIDGKLSRPTIYNQNVIHTYITLHYIALHCIALHYIHTHIHIYIYNYVYIYIHMYRRPIITNPNSPNPNLPGNILELAINC